MPTARTLVASQYVVHAEDAFPVTFGAREYNVLLFLVRNRNIPQKKNLEGKNSVLITTIHMGKCETDIEVRSYKNSISLVYVYSSMAVNPS